MLVPLLACLVLWCDAAPANDAAPADAATAVQQVEMRANMWWEDMKEMELSELLEKINEEELDKLETSVLEELSDELWQRQSELIGESELNEEEWDELFKKIWDVLEEREAEPAAAAEERFRFRPFKENMIKKFYPGIDTPADRVEPGAQQQDRQPALPPFDELVLSVWPKMNKKDQETLMKFV